MEHNDSIPYDNIIFWRDDDDCNDEVEKRWWWLVVLKRQASGVEGDDDYRHHRRQHHHDEYDENDDGFACSAASCSSWISSLLFSFHKSNFCPLLFSSLILQSYSQREKISITLLYYIITRAALKRKVCTYTEKAKRKNSHKMKREKKIIRLNERKRWERYEPVHKDK